MCRGTGRLLWPLPELRVTNQNAITQFLGLQCHSAPLSRWPGASSGPVVRLSSSWNKTDNYSARSWASDRLGTVPTPTPKCSRSREPDRRGPAKGCGRFRVEFVMINLNALRNMNRHWTNRLTRARTGHTNTRHADRAAPRLGPNSQLSSWLRLELRLASLGRVVFDKFVLADRIVGANLAQRKPFARSHSARQPEAGEFG